MTPVRATFLLRAGIIGALVIALIVIYYCQRYLVHCGLGCDPGYLALVERILGSYSGPLGISIAALVAPIIDRKARLIARVSIVPTVAALVLTFLFCALTADAAWQAAYSVVPPSTLLEAYKAWPPVVGGALTTILALLSNRDDHGKPAGGEANAK